MRPEYGPGSIRRKTAKNRLPTHVEIKSAGFLPIAGSPHTDFYTEAFQCLPLSRLQRIEQSSIGLVYGPSFPAVEKAQPQSYETTRWRHTLEVAALTEAILTQNGFRSEDVKLGIAAALLHDIATPAMGDVTMHADLAALDEERNWDKVLDEKGKDFLKRHHLDPNVITKIIVNGGVFGEVLDIADRISYVISDSHEIARTEENSDTELLTFLAAHPAIGSIYQDVQITGEDVYFADAERLFAFLKLRAMLRRDFAEHPYSVGRNRAATNAIRDLLERKEITPDDLRAMEDGDLYARLTNERLAEWQRKYRDSYNKAQRTVADSFDPDSSRSLYQQFRRFNPEVEVFQSEDAVRKREEELRNQRNTIILGADSIKKFDTGAGYKVSDDEGGIVTFKEHKPDYAEELDGIAEQTSGWILASKRVVRVVPKT